jgi:hypothetical protein
MAFVIIIIVTFFRIPRIRDTLLKRSPDLQDSYGVCLTHFLGRVVGHRGGPDEVSEIVGYFLCMCPEKL